MINEIKRIAFIAYYLFLKKLNKDKNIYLIYTMGKVGSATIHFSLKKKKPYSDIFHVHFLSKNWLNKPLPKRDIVIGNAILDYIRDNPKKKIKIITLTREPVSRDISALFENPELHFKDIKEKKNEDIIRYIEENLDFSYPLTWFDSEFFNYTNINLYNLQFDKDKGYGIYRFNNVDILCLKLERLNEVYSIALKEFMGLDLDELILGNITDVTGLNERYSYVKENIRLNRAKLITLYNSKYVQHFYSESEINDFINKWS